MDFGVFVWEGIRFLFAAALIVALSYLPIFLLLRRHNDVSKETPGRTLELTESPAGPLELLSQSEIRPPFATGLRWKVHEEIVQPGLKGFIRFPLLNHVHV